MSNKDPLKDIDLQTLMQAWHGLAKREQDLERIAEREEGRRTDKGVWTIDDDQRAAERVVLDGLEDEPTIGTEVIELDDGDEGTEMTSIPLPDC